MSYTINCPDFISGIDASEVYNSIMYNGMENSKAKRFLFFLNVCNKSTIYSGTPIKVFLK